jgi:hypothetical protein
MLSLVGQVEVRLFTVDILESQVNWMLTKRGSIQLNIFSTGISQTVPAILLQAAAMSSPWKLNNHLPNFSLEHLSVSLGPTKSYAPHAYLDPEYLISNYST